MKNDYYPFGMIMPGRTYSAGSDYRYGFNGKENDKDVSGDGNQYDYGLRIYNARIGKFLSVDPLSQSYPWYTPYQFAGNTPIQAIDLDGAEEYHYLLLRDNEGENVLVSLEVKDIYRTVVKQWGLMRGGIYPMETETVKNPHKIFYVHRLSEIVTKGANNAKFTFPYEETVSFKTEAAAFGVTDEAFERTADDYWALVYGNNMAIATGTIDESDWTQEDDDFTRFRQTGKGGKGSVLTKKVLRQLAKVFEKHHITPKSLRAIPFVAKAIKGGFKIDGLKNLTPLQKFFKHAGIGIHGKHPKYTDQIRKYLETRNVANYTKEEAKDFMFELNDYIIKRIKQSKGKKLNDIDLKLDKFKPK